MTKLKDKKACKLTKKQRRIIEFFTHNKGEMKAAFKTAIDRAAFQGVTPPTDDQASDLQLMKDLADIL